MRRERGLLAPARPDNAGDRCMGIVAKNASVVAVPARAKAAMRTTIAREIAIGAASGLFSRPPKKSFFLGT